MLAALVSSSACSRGDDDAAPIIPLPGRAAAPMGSATTSSPGDPPPPDEVPPATDEPLPAPPAPPPGQAPAPQTPPIRPHVPYSPLAMPWPISAPVQALAQLPGFSSLPKMLGVPGAPASPVAPASPASPASPARPAPGKPTPAADPQGEASVVVYGAKWCGACTKLKSDLTARRVPYTFVDVDDAPNGNAARNEIPAASRGKIPVTRVTKRNGQVVWVQGCDPARIESTYRS